MARARSGWNLGDLDPERLAEFYLAMLPDEGAGMAARIRRLRQADGLTVLFSARRSLGMPVSAGEVVLDLARPERLEGLLDAAIRKRPADGVADMLSVWIDLYRDGAGVICPGLIAETFSSLLSALVECLPPVILQQLSMTEVHSGT